MAIELPKDAKGREIPLDTKVLYDKEGNELCVKVVEFRPFSKEWSFAVQKGSSDRGVVYRCPNFVYLEKPAPPDSWEKLEEDLSEISKGTVCHYFHKGDSNTCEGCPAAGTGSCWPTTARDIASRIRKLRGEGE